MLFTYFMVGVALCIPELVLFRNWPFLAALVMKNKIFEISFSLLLGIILGKAMGITGVTFAIGSIFATMITKFIYSTHLLDHYDNGRKYIVENKGRIKEGLDTFVKAAKWWYRLFTAPIRFMKWIKNQMTRMASAASRVKVKLQDFIARAKRGLLRAKRAEQF